MAKDYYSILGVSKTATPEDIKKAYRKLAHQYHPDKTQGGDHEKFKEVNEAYQVLSDPSKRTQYDQFGTTFEQASRSGGFGNGFSGAGGFDFSDFARGFGFNAGNVEFEDPFDIFSDIFGANTRTRTRRARGVDLEYGLTLTFEEAAFGVEKEISIGKKDVCERCGGLGAEPQTKLTTCPKCHGAGQIRTQRRTIFGSMSTVTTCDRCEGSGKIAETPCRECKGAGAKRRVKTLKIKIPAGVDDGSRIRISGEGEVGYRGSDFGDLYLKINVRLHPVLKREGETILSEIPSSFYQAALGTEVEVETLDGKIRLKIPAGTQSGKVFRLKGRGVPRLQGSGRGDHLVTVRVVTPTKLTKKEKELFKKLAEENGESINTDQGFWDRF